MLARGNCVRHEGRTVTRDDEARNLEDPLATGMDSRRIRGEWVFGRSRLIEPQVGEDDQAGLGFDQGGEILWSMPRRFP